MLGLKLINYLPLRPGTPISIGNYGTRGDNMLNALSRLIGFNDNT